MTKIALGTDHAGFVLKELVKRHLIERGFDMVDFGTDSEDSVDYPDFILPAARCVASGDCDFGIVFGGSGNGEATTANKVRGIRCALVWNRESARLAKVHNNANMLSLGARLIDHNKALEWIDTWLDASFEGGRHIRRLEKMEPPE